MGVSYREIVRRLAASIKFSPVGLAVETKANFVLRIKMDILTFKYWGKYMSLFEEHELLAREEKAKKEHKESYNFLVSILVFVCKTPFKLFGVVISIIYKEKKSILILLKKAT